MGELERALGRIEQLGADLRKYSADYADALTWGGPTIYPSHPVNEDRAYSDARAIEMVARVVRQALEGAPDVQV